MPPHPLTNFEIQKYYQNEPKTHWIALYVNGNNIIYFESFRVEHIPREIKKLIGNKSITNIYRIQAYNSIMCIYFYIGFIDFMLKKLKFARLYKFIFS